MKNKTNIHKTVILNLIQDLQRLPFQCKRNDNNMRGRFQIKFGMTSLYNNGAFTLIELLVVVLIIAILAAVAVPRYQTAVEKARFATFIPLLKAVANAKSVYYLSNGEWPEKFEELSIDLPKEFEIQDDTSYKQVANNPSKKQYIYLEANEHRVRGRMYLSDGSSLLYYMPVSEFQSEAACAGTLNKRAEQFCKNLPGALPYPSDTMYSWWRIP